MSDDNNNQNKQNNEQKGPKKPLTVESVELKLAQQAQAVVEKELEPVVREMAAAKKALKAATEKAEEIYERILEAADEVKKLTPAKQHNKDKKHETPIKTRD